MAAEHGDKMATTVANLFYASTRIGALGKIPQMILRFVFGVELPRRLQCGERIDLPHGARGLVVHGRAVIGDDVTLHHNVTLGASRGGGPAPTLESGVEVGCGAAILGGITIGKGATIGANAVVLHDVPAGAVAVGNPARIIEKTPTQ